MDELVRVAEATPSKNEIGETENSERVKLTNLITQQLRVRVSYQPRPLAKHSRRLMQGLPMTCRP